MDEPSDQPFFSPFSLSQIPGGALEPDSSPSDDNSSDVSDTRSLRASMYNYILENGRTYHSYRAGAYMLPNDEVENERLDWQYYTIYILLGQRHHLAPLKANKLKRVLDIGTGTGKWAIEFGQVFPHTIVIGTDLSPIQPTEGLPPNVHFLVDDANEEDWGSSKFSFIHTRMLLGAFEDFKAIIKRSYDYLEPGGYMESQELYNMLFCADDTLTEDNAFLKWIKLQDEAAMQMARPLRIANKLKKWYEECGFVDVHEEVFQLPINGWPKDPRFKFIGKFWQKSLLDGLQAFSLGWFHRAWGWTREEIEAYLVPVRQALNDRRVHSFHKFYIVWGRKPYPSERAGGTSSTATATPSSSFPPKPSTGSFRRAPGS